MHSLTLAFAALFVLSALSFNLTQTWADSSLDWLATPHRARDGRVIA
jgi:hypothetical protein